MKEKIETIHQNVVLESIEQNFIYKICPEFIQKPLRNKILLKRLGESKPYSQSC